VTSQPPGKGLGCFEATLDSCQGFVDTGTPPILPSIFRAVHDSLTGGKRETAGRQVPFCLFTDPEFARVSLSEKEGKAQGVAYRLFKIPMEAVMRASTLSETRGFLKALIEVDRDRILVHGGRLGGIERLRLLIQPMNFALRGAPW
jgi:hypothetical protein